MCPYCDRKIGARKDGLRKKHYINERRGWGWGYRLKECRGSSPSGPTPTSNRNGSHLLECRNISRGHAFTD